MNKRDSEAELAKENPRSSHLNVQSEGANGTVSLCVAKGTAKICGCYRFQ